MGLFPQDTISICQKKKICIQILLKQEPSLPSAEKLL